MTDDQPTRRRTRRSRHEAAPDSPALPDESASAAPSGGAAAQGRGRDLERAWRDLAGSTPSLVGVGGALRARDVARPTDDDLNRAEREVVIVRRDWKPPADAPAFSPKSSRSPRTS